MDIKKIFMILLIGMFLFVPMVSAVWWNPFTWFQNDDPTTELSKGGVWYLDHIDGVQLEYFDTSIENLGNGKATLCLLPKEDLRINDEIIKQSKATLKINNVNTGLVEPSDMEVETEGGNIKKMCVDVDKATEDYARFGSNSALFLYTNESITATIDNVTIGKLSLITEDFDYKDGRPHIQVSSGSQKLTHYFQIENWTSETITNLRTINLKDSQEIERNAVLKFLSYEDANVTNFDCINQTLANSTVQTYCYENGTKTATREKWNNMSLATEGNDYIVGVVMDTKKGDYLDILFDYYGVDVASSPIDWASVSTADLKAYWKFDEASGTLYDSHNSYDATNNGATYGATGILNNALDFENGDQDWVDSNMAPQSEDWAFSLWMKAESFVNSRRLLKDGRCYVSWYANTIEFTCNDESSGYMAIQAGSVTQTGVWYHVAGSFTTGQQYLWINGTEVGSDTSSISLDSTDTDEMLIGASAPTSNNWDGLIDEVAIFTGTLSQDDVTALYNNGLGFAYPFTSDSPPTVTGEQPANNTIYTTTTTVTFNATVSDDINLDNVSLIIDGSIDQTNTSGTNNSLYIFTKSLSTGQHNWSIIAYDNESQSTETDLRFLNISIISPTIELSYPADDLTVENVTQSIYAYVYDNIAVDNVSLYIDGVLNETNSSGLNATNYSFTKTFTDGSFDWYIKAVDNQGFETDSATRTLNVNTTPFIDFITPPTLVNYANITQEYIPMKVNVSTIYFENITYSLRNINGTNYTQFYTNQTFDINFTNMPDGHYHYDVTVCATTGQCNSTETRHINHDVTAPTVNITSPSLLNNLGYNGLNVTFTANFSDDHLDSCWYDYNGTNTTFPCTSDQFNSTSFLLSNYDTDMTFYANDTFGNLLIEPFDWDYMIYYINNTYEDPAVVGETSTFTYDAYWLNDSYSSINAYVNWNGNRKPLATTTTDGNIVNVTSTFLLTGLTVDTNVTFLFEFVIDGSYYNTSSYTQEVRTIKIDDCTNYSNYLFNFTMKDEEQNTVINASNETGLIEIDLFINSDGSEILQYSSTESLVNPVYVCSELDLENRGFNFDLDVGFSSTDRVNEFYFVDEGEIETGDTPFNVSLMDLKTVDSTSFLFNYFDVDGLPVDESIVQVWRKYIGDGVFREVERAKADQNGDTIVHLVEEDVIYYFVITYQDAILYTTSTYNALCQTTPCTIQIEASGDGATFPTDWDLIDGGAYSISEDESARTVTLDYSLDDLGKMNLTIYKYNSDGSYSPLTSSSETGTSGSLVATVPLSAGNVSFFATVEKDDEFINSEWINFEEKAIDWLGITLSLFLGAMVILSLGLIAVNQGVGTIPYVILGVIISGALGLLRTELSTGVNIVIYLVIAGGMILWKLTRGRN